VENCFDDLNDFHFKKPKSNLPAFEKKFTSCDENEEDYFIVHTDWLIRKCDGYNKQDLKKNRDISENICVNYQILIQGLIKFQPNGCIICDQQFHCLNKPTFDHIDNNRSHTLENCVLCCCKCNQRRGTKSLEQVQVKVQKLKFCKEHGLATTIADSGVIELILKGVTGGNSFVSRRYKIAGETHINRLIHDIDNYRIISKDTENIMTHVCGVDFNYLYPSPYSSIKTNKIGYTDSRLLMCGGVKFYIIHKNRITSIIQRREELFIVSVNGRIPEEWFNKFLISSNL
jgi:hypothetical protein